MYLGIDGVPYLLCPVVRTGNTVSYPATVEFGEWVLTRSAFRYAMYDVVVGSGPIDLTAAYPPFLNSDSFLEHLEESVRHNADSPEALERRFAETAARASV